MICHVLLFPGCLCGSSGSFQFSTLHHLGAIAKKLILMLSFLSFLWLNFVVSDRDVGFYLNVNVLWGGSSPLQFSTWCLKTLEKNYELWTFYLLLAGVMRTSFLSVFEGKAVLKIVVLILMLCGQHCLLSKLISRSRNDTHRKEIA